ncbi:MAG: hypothetical protein AAGG46_11730, partial [Planctomycetota bacterium]
MDDDLKRAIYGLPARQAAAQQAEPLAAAAAAPAEVPDYLRASRSSLVWRVAPAAAAMLLLAGAAVIFGPGGLYDQAREGQPEEPAEVASAAPVDLSQAEGAASPPVVVDEQLPDAAAAAASEEATLTDSSGESPLATVGADAVLPPAIETPPTSDPSLTPGSTDQPDTEPLELADNQADVASVGSGPLTADPPLAGDLAGEPPFNEPSPAATAQSGDAELAGSPDADGSTEVEALQPEGPLELEEPLEPSEPAVVGMVTTTREVLLRYSDGFADWERPQHIEGALPNVTAGDRLLSLPSYRPRLRLDGVDVSLSGATQIEVLPGSASDGIDLSNAEAVKTAKVKLVFGRLILANTGSEPATI